MYKQRGYFTVLIFILNNITTNNIVPPCVFSTNIYCNYLYYEYIYNYSTVVVLERGSRVFKFSTR